MTKETQEDPLKFWIENCWSQGRTPWHLTKPHDFLIKHLHRLLNGRKVSDCNILVPLCGKSVDLIWLKDQGFKQIIGVEGVRTAIQDFSSESGISLKETVLQGMDIPSFESEDGRLKIILTDFFKLDHPSVNASVDCVWDRGSLVAILPEHRPQYTASIQRLLRKESSWRYLAAITEYDKSHMEGPPHSITHEELKGIFGLFADAEVIEVADVSSGEPLKFDPKTTKRMAYLMFPL